MIDEARSARPAAIFAALSHPVRIAIVDILREGELSVGAIASRLELAQPSVSQHLAVLQKAGIIVVRPQGTARFYRVRGPRISTMLDLLVEFCEVHNLQGSGEDQLEDA